MKFEQWDKLKAKVKIENEYVDTIEKDEEVEVSAFNYSKGKLNLYHKEGYYNPDDFELISSPASATSGPANNNLYPPWRSGDVLECKGNIRFSPGHRLVFLHFFPNNLYFECTLGDVHLISDFILSQNSQIPIPKPSPRTPYNILSYMSLGDSLQAKAGEDMRKEFLEPTSHSCSTNLKSYTGFIESYQFCTICDKKFR